MQIGLWSKLVDKPREYHPIPNKTHMDQEDFVKQCAMTSIVKQ